MRNYPYVSFQSVVRCLWHPKLNQIMVGTGNGLAKVYYDPVKSQRYVIKSTSSPKFSLILKFCDYAKI